MQDSEYENVTFVNLLEEHKDILDISQIPEHKKKKKEAVELFIPKWESVCGKKLSQDSLFKKINNMKSRCKLAAAKQKPLAQWQLKLVELTTPGAQENGHRTVAVCTSNNLKQDDTLEIDPTPVVEFFSKYETLETKSLNNEQLQRLVLLKQLRVADLQLKAMEKNCIKSFEKIELDFVGWDGEEAVETFDA